MGWHNHICIYAQPFVSNGKIQALCQNFARRFFNEYRHPLLDREGDKINSNTLCDSIAFHSVAPSTGQETCAQLCMLLDAGL